MNTLTKAVLALATVTMTLVASPGTASAEYRNHYGARVGDWTLSGQLQYGIWTGDGDLDAYGFGLGFRGGYTFPVGVYAGGRFDYFFGEGESAGVGNLAGGDVHLNVYDFMGEVGYDFWVHKAGIIRPKLGLGVGVAHGSGCVSAIFVGSACDGRSDSGFAFDLGVEYKHFFDNVFLQTEMRYGTISVDGPNPSAFIFGVGVGVAL